MTVMGAQGFRSRNESQNTLDVLAKGPVELRSEYVGDKGLRSHVLANPLVYIAHMEVEESSICMTPSDDLYDVLSCDCTLRNFYK